MRIGEAFPGSYLKASDLGGKRIGVTIDAVHIENIGSDNKPVLYFQGKEKGLVLNKTNANMISEIVGSDETDEWQGHRVALYPTKVDFQGKRVDAIRVTYPNGSQPPPPVQHDDGSDDIPF